MGRLSELFVVMRIFTFYILHMYCDNSVVIMICRLADEQSQISFESIRDTESY